MRQPNPLGTPPGGFLRSKGNPMIYRYPSHEGMKSGTKTGESTDSGRFLIRIRNGGQSGDGWFDARDCERVW